MKDHIDPVPALQLALDHRRHRVTRAGYPPVDLGGNCRLWKLLTKLSHRHDGYFPKNELVAAVWDDLGAVSVEDVTLWSAVSELRSKLAPLNLGIKHVKGLGYRLDDRKR